MIFGKNIWRCIILLVERKDNMNDFLKGVVVLIIAVVLVSSAYFYFNPPGDVDEELSMVNTEGWRSTPEVVLDALGAREIIIERYVIPSEDKTVPEVLGEPKKSLLWGKDFVFPVDDDMWYTRTLGCIDIVYEGEYKGRKFPELEKICQKVLDENDARENDHESAENRREIKEFLDTFKGVK